MRIALSQGLNREIDHAFLSRSQREHRCKLWWTIYVLECRISTLMGAPTLIHVRDIPLPKPPLVSVHISESALALHVELATQLGHVIDSEWDLPMATFLVLITFQRYMISKGIWAEDSFPVCRRFCIPWPTYPRI